MTVGSVEHISFFDNVASRGSSHSTNLFSCVRLVELNHMAGTVTEIHTYPAPDSLSAKS